MQNGRGSEKKEGSLNTGRIDLAFQGSLNLNALGTTLAIIGTVVLLILFVSGVFIVGK